MHTEHSCIINSSSPNFASFASQSEEGRRFDCSELAGTGAYEGLGRLGRLEEGSLEESKGLEVCGAATRSKLLRMSRMIALFFVRTRRSARSMRDTVRDRNFLVVAFLVVRA